LAQVLARSATERIRICQAREAGVIVMACMKVAFVMLTILPPGLMASACEEDGSCPVTTNAAVLLQTRSNSLGAVSISSGDEDDSWGKFAHYKDYSMQGMGTSILVRTNGFNNISSTFDGTAPSCYDVCMAQTEPKCLAFTFASPDWHFAHNRWCRLHTEIGPMFHRNEFMLGLPSSRHKDLSSDGAFFLQRSTRNGTKCLAEVDSHFDSIVCDAANPKQKWYRDVEGIYINYNTNHCISNKDGNTSFRKFWEPGPVPEKQGRLSVKHSMAHVQQYDEVHTLE